MPCSWIRFGSLTEIVTSVTYVANRPPVHLDWSCPLETGAASTLLFPTSYLGPLHPEPLTMVSARRVAAFLSLLLSSVVLVSSSQTPFEPSSPPPVPSSAVCRDAVCPPPSSTVARESLTVPSVNRSNRNNGMQFRGCGQRWF